MGFSDWFQLEEEPDRFSFENCRTICSDILETDFNEGKSQENSADRMETLIDDVRFLAELVLWGEKFDPSVVHLFMNMEMFKILFRWVCQEFATIALKVQILQTISILIQNLHGDSFANLEFPYEIFHDVAGFVRMEDSDSDILPAFINCIRTIFSRLSEVPWGVVPANDLSGSSIPLLWIIAEYVGHPDSLVRTTARSVIINALTRPIQTIRAFTDQWGSFFALVIAESFIRKLIDDQEDYLRSSWFALHGMRLPYESSSAATRQDDLVDTFGFLDDFLDSTDGASEIARNILRMVLSHVSEISCVSIRFQCLRKLIIPATNGVYLREIFAVIGENLNDGLLLGNERDGFDVLFSIFENSSCVNFLSHHIESSTGHAEGRSSAVRRLPIVEYVHSITRLTLKIMEDPEKADMADIWRALCAMRYFLSERTTWRMTFRAVFHRVLFSITDKVLSQSTVDTSADEADETNANHDSQWDPSIFCALIAAAHTFLQHFGNLDYASIEESNFGGFQYQSAEWVEGFHAHLVFLALSSFKQQEIAEENRIDQSELFDFLGTIPRSEPTEISITDFSNHCGMIGVRCQIVHYENRTPRRASDRVSAEKDWAIPNIYFGDDAALADGNLLYFFFADATLYFVEPSLGSLDRGSIVLQLPAFYCSTVVFSSTDSEMLIECHTLDMPGRDIVLLRVDFVQAKICRNVAEACCAYIQKVRENVHARVEKFIYAVSDMVYERTPQDEVSVTTYSAVS
ncbi:hypothetical protein XU18_3911 [Perkinsela sp. CCAP 1560/4]|nr:hypothetical protein XU18_3911 [Perkinsela sp. CCAP 1560/4]|eukprot:KNH04927.1 hypothetical protein XU18_3911 [Perkinsela sp. CCAP 1560/4]